MDGCNTVQRHHVSYERVMVCQMRNVLPAMTSVLHHNMCASCTYLKHHQLTWHHILHEMRVPKAHITFFIVGKRQ
jgi:hypothetical protein